MTKNTQTQPYTLSSRDLEENLLAYDKELKKFLNEFGMKDRETIPLQRHKELMLFCFYWVDEGEQQGYYINDDIERNLRGLTKDEKTIYEDLMYEATIY